jgi:hypothetical protein
MTHRPKNATGKDANHSIPRHFLRDRCGGFTIAPKPLRGSSLSYTANYRGHRITAHDMSNYGGVLADWLIESDNGGAAWCEIKTPEAAQEANSGMTKGEQWLYENCGIEFRIVTTDDEFEMLLQDLTNE